MICLFWFSFLFFDWFLGKTNYLVFLDTIGLLVLLLLLLLLFFGLGLGFSIFGFSYSAKDLPELLSPYNSSLSFKSTSRRDLK